MPDELTSIFISYARPDSPFVDQLEADPHRQGFAPWLDCRGLAGGQQWRRELQEAVDRCQVLLVVLSPDAVASPYVQIEYGWPGLCVITEGNMLATLEQMVSFLFRRRPDSNSTRNLQGAHFLIAVPASIHLQLDGSSVQLEDYLSRADREALQQAPDRAQVMVSQRFDAAPHALRVALPKTYDKMLFEHLSYTGETHTADEQQPTKAPSERHNRQHEQVRRESSGELITMLLEDGQKITITGVVMAPGKRQRYVIAGHMVKQRTGETKPLAIRIEGDAAVLLRTGELVPLADVLKVQSGAEVIVVGKKNKRGVIKAKRVLLPSL